MVAVPDDAPPQDRPGVSPSIRSYPPDLTSQLGDPVFIAYLAIAFILFIVVVLILWADRTRYMRLVGTTAAPNPLILILLSFFWAFALAYGAYRGEMGASANGSPGLVLLVFLLYWFLMLMFFYTFPRPLHRSSLFFLVVAVLLNMWLLYLCRHDPIAFALIGLVLLFTIYTTYWTYTVREKERKEEGQVDN